MKGKTLRGSLSFLSAGLVLLLSGCSNLDILNPKGSVGLAERDLIATSTWAMLIVVVPVIALTLLFAWRYRASNKNAEYRPKWVALDRYRNRRLDDSDADHSVPGRVDVEEHA